MFVIVIIFMIIGLIGVFIPGLPGNGLIFLSTLGYGLLTKFEKISMSMIIFFGILTMLAFLFDYAASILGAKKFGATKAGIIGGVLGGLSGILVFSLPGLLIGQFLGTLIGELYYGKALNVSIKSGFGTIIGYVLGVIVNTTIGLTIIGLFILKVK
ncbi:DUF456 domain-containing protein [Crassaminicella thermophila]|uniref:DUF456 domain-containing protein n=1 Tax=Crassaminicella thermophila TaxID=2599308 RepID=A0A5C0SCH2_CRATE|nr:DUF456 domain-containing protein [Crassaminicella thermophila]QEK11780.1 DUF456 domain-containing protein [Crassaminicella thermophila]